MIGRYIFIFALSLAYISTSSADIRTLVPPQGYYTAIDSGKRYDDTCNPLPLPHTGNLNFRSKYEGSQTARDQLNKAAYKDYKTKTQDINQFEKRTNKLIDQFMNSGQTKLLHCAVSGLRQWATAGALLSKDSNHTGRAIRKWVLGSVSGAYLRLKFSKSNPLAGLNNDTDVIESWFTALAEQVIDDWDSPPLEKMNNHEYWAAWAVMSTSISLNRHDMFLWAIQQYLIAMGQITEEGYLPNELKRETRGLAYHNYSLNPLTMIAAFSEANSMPITFAHQGALIRLADTVTQGIHEPELFARKTGYPQNLEDLQSASKFTWLEPYCALIPCSKRQQSWRNEM